MTIRLAAIFIVTLLTLASALAATSGVSSIADPAAACASRTGEARACAAGSDAALSNGQAARSATPLERDAPGADVQSPQSGLRRADRVEAIAFGTVAALQALLIAWLLLEHRQRRRAEAEVGRRLQEARAHLVTITHLDRMAAMGEVTAAITHELNQPLEAILHNAEAGEMMLEAGMASPEEMRHIFADIRRIDTRAAEIIQRLRRLLRKKEFETGPLDVNQLTRETATLLAPVAGSKGVRLELDLAADAVQIAGDQVHLQQVLLNVLLNGIEAMTATPRERRQLAVRTTNTGDHVEVSVRDSGPGIRAETMSRIFEPFYTTKGEGMGIGLSIARTIVEAHGGRIGARNNPEGGATVSFVLPMSNAA